MNREENNGSGVGLGLVHVNNEDATEAQRPQSPLPTEPELVEETARMRNWLARIGSPNTILRFDLRIAPYLSDVV